MKDDPDVLFYGIVIASLPLTGNLSLVLGFQIVELKPSRSRNPHMSIRVSLLLLNWKSEFDHLFEAKLLFTSYYKLVLSAACHYICDLDLDPY